MLGYLTGVESLFLMSTNFTPIISGFSLTSSSSNQFWMMEKYKQRHEYELKKFCLAMISWINIEMIKWEREKKPFHFAKVYRMTNVQTQKTRNVFFLFACTNEAFYSIKYGMVHFYKRIFSLFSFDTDFYTFWLSVAIYLEQITSRCADSYFFLSAQLQPLWFKEFLIFLHAKSMPIWWRNVSCILLFYWWMKCEQCNGTSLYMCNA